MSPPTPSASPKHPRSRSRISGQLFVAIASLVCIALTATLVPSLAEAADKKIQSAELGASMTVPAEMRRAASRLTSGPADFVSPDLEFVITVEGDSTWHIHFAAPNGDLAYRDWVRVYISGYPDGSFLNTGRCGETFCSFTGIAQGQIGSVRAPGVEGSHPYCFLAVHGRGNVPGGNLHDLGCHHGPGDLPDFDQITPPPITVVAEDGKVEPNPMWASWAMAKWGPTSPEHDPRWGSLDNPILNVLAEQVTECVIGSTPGQLSAMPTFDLSALAGCTAEPVDDAAGALMSEIDPNDLSLGAELARGLQTCMLELFGQAAGEKLFDLDVEPWGLDTAGGFITGCFGKGVKAYFEVETVFSWDDYYQGLMTVVGIDMLAAWIGGGPLGAGLAGLLAAFEYWWTTDYPPAIPGRSAWLFEQASADSMAPADPATYVMLEHLDAAIRRSECMCARPPAVPELDLTADKGIAFIHDWLRPADGDTMFQWAGLRAQPSIDLREVGANYFDNAEVEAGATQGCGLGGIANAHRCAAASLPLAAAMVYNHYNVASPGDQVVVCFADPRILPPNHLDSHEPLDSRPFNCVEDGYEAVLLSAVDAVGIGPERGVRFMWRTELEIDTRSFDVLRKRTDGLDEEVTVVADIPARGFGDYDVVDLGAEPGVEYRYTLREHENNGSVIDYVIDGRATARADYPSPTERTLFCPSNFVGPDKSEITQNLLLPLFQWTNCGSGTPQFRIGLEYPSGHSIYIPVPSGWTSLPMETWMFTEQGKYKWRVESRSYSSGEWQSPLHSKDAEFVYSGPLYDPPPCDDDGVDARSSEGEETDPSAVLATPLPTPDPDPAPCPTAGSESPPVELPPATKGS